MATSQDTEITLGTGKMLALFFGLVALCAVFFGTGFSLGRSSVKPMNADMANPPASVNPSVRPSAVKPASAPPNLTFYKAVEQKDSDTPSAPTSLPTGPLTLRCLWRKPSRLRPIRWPRHQLTATSCRWRRSANKRTRKHWSMLSRRNNIRLSPQVVPLTSYFTCRWVRFPTSKTRKLCAPNWSATGTTPF